MDKRFYFENVNGSKLRKDTGSYKLYITLHTCVCELNFNIVKL